MSAAPVGLILGARKLYLALPTGQPVRYELLSEPLADGLKLENAAALGQRLGALLRKTGARELAIGIPAHWLLSHGVTAPGAAPDMAHAALRFQAENWLATDAADWTVDYSGAIHPSEPRKVMLGAIRKTHLEACRLLAHSAGMKLISLRVGTEMLQNLCPPGAMLLSWDEDDAELAVLQDGMPTLLRAISGGLPPEDHARRVGGEIRRTLLTLSSKPTALICWDPVGPLAGELQGVLEIQRPGLEGLAILTSPGSPAPGSRSLAALALAQSLLPVASGPKAGSKASGQGWDFAAPRIARVEAHPVRRAAVWAMALSAVAVLLILWAMVDMGQRRTTIHELQDRVEKIEKQVKSIDLIDSRIRLLQGWKTQGSVYLDALKALTLQTPPDGSLWLTTFNLTSKHGGQCSGKALGEPRVLEFIDRLRSAGGFKDFKVLELRGADRMGRDVSFTVQFTYQVGS